MKIPFNKSYYNEEEVENIRECLAETGVSSGNKYSKLCEEWFYQKTGKRIILTTSCTAALEMSALLSDIKVGDEVIMPSFTFVTTASSFVLRGAVPVFVDINPDTLNINENLIEQVITEKTKAIVVMHYAGIACNMDKIIEIAHKYNLLIIEDAAQAVGAKYKNEYLGCIGDIGCFSFHETKNITSGEGGAIIINNEKLKNLAEIVSEKGTNRQAFLIGEVEKYTWIELGSSYKMSDINAAVLYSQLENFDEIQKRRMEIWNKYYDIFYEFEKAGYVRRPVISKDCAHNAHIFYVLFNNKENRNKFIKYLKENDIEAKFHYIPLHSSPAGRKYCRIATSMTNTENVADTIVRMPLFYDLSDIQLEYIFAVVKRFFYTKVIQKDLEVLAK